MLKWILHRVLDRAFARFQYDATYVHDVLDASTSGLLKFMLAQPMNLHRQGITKDAWYAAKIATIRHEDCGPCAQLVVDMALQDGVERAVVKAIVTRDFKRLTADAELGLRFAEAVAGHESTDQWREEVMRRFGHDGLVSLAFAMAQTKTYPTMKRVLGYAHVCERLRVGNEEIMAARAA
jgi:hypothetical protein